MDVNLALLAGRLTVAPELEWQADGSQRARLLVCVRSELRGRVDVVPVVVPAVVATEALIGADAGDRVYIAGPLMRPHSPEAWEPSGRIEVIADSVHVGLDADHGGSPR